MEVIITSSGTDDVPLAKLSLKFSSKEARKRIHSNCQVRVIQLGFLPMVRMKMDGYLLKECCSNFHGPNCLLLVLKMRWKIAAKLIT